MPIGSTEREIKYGYDRLVRSAAAARRCHEHYLDGRGDSHPDVTALVAKYPWSFGSFADPAWERYHPDPDAAPPDGLRVGELTTARLPAVARFARHGHVLITEGDPDVARSLLQAITLRLAVATAPGTVRFALADAAGQGRYLSAFLRLPALLRVSSSGQGGGVAASPEEIEDLLRALTGHVVSVIQTRLTNVYDSIEDYNANTVGITVPYLVLALTAFPEGITDRAAGLLTRLARNGPRAGLYIVATAEPGSEIGGHVTTLNTTRDGDLTWDDPDLGECVLRPDTMPSAARANPWLDAVGTTANLRIRELTFGQIATPSEQLWSGDTATGLDVQIGVTMTGESQHFVLGVRGVHHGLVGGDTRMGKTNLLHVLICQLALRYPPEELELYLLDFKEVEFDAYLTERLPHARAITSRTDREFGLSMLRRFHDEIDRRARLCREAKVTDLTDYRRQTGQPLPRALVIMDEFQVLFTHEDRLAREAAQLLADLAKRGAAFGLHLLLATQSPGGLLTAYLRPVYEQMALRIALGCMQPSVSQAILGEGNDGATRLIRAGDAIYNDRRGEGANPVARLALLPTRERLALISGIRALGGGREYPAPASFDPDAPAVFAPNDPACFDPDAPAEHSPGPPGAVAAWLGEALEIKPPTTAVFDRYVRSNLLVVGAEEHGHGLLLATVLSAATQCTPAQASFTIAHFARPSSPYHGFFGVLDGLPHDVRICDGATVGEELAALGADLDERLAAESPRPARFFLVAGMHRWHELTTEGDYGRPSETAVRLARLADKGPDVGIHVVAWADSYGTAERSLRRAGIARFGLRAVLRLFSPAESDALLGVAAAVGLDDNRALFRDTEWPIDQVEKFKPYSISSLRAYAARLASARLTSTRLTSDGDTLRSPA
ncbi:MAG TPA: FtsK/SpoIIIE domain-containing protein [Streptosporangiaceae bacterium]|nr:FtsK/SpoIIIE domain-containing protein [Streptosporangiaceae bacterium]